MAKGDQINFKPHFKKDLIRQGAEALGPTLPCEGEVGDLFVFKPLDEGEPDSTPLGRASLWFCTKGAEGDGRHAIWQRVQFDTHTTCAVSPPNPPQNHPKLKDG
jgi:hypothetical protein